MLIEGEYIIVYEHRKLDVIRICIIQVQKLLHLLESELVDVYFPNIYCTS